MAKTASEWKKIMTDAYLANTDVQVQYSIDLNKTFEQQFSKVSFESILFYTIGIVLNAIEVIFEYFKSDVNTLLINKNAHTATWYANKLLDYQHGMDLPEGDDEYDNTGLTDDEIAAMKIIASATATETDTYALLIKVKSADGTLFTTTQIEGINAYLKQIKDVGVPYEIRNANADWLRLVYDIYYDAKILDSTGKRLDGTSDTPVQDAISNYVQAIKFDGYLTLFDLNNIVAAVDGVSIPNLLSAQSKYGTYDWTAINARIKPYSGWFKIYDSQTDLTLNFIPA